MLCLMEEVQIILFFAGGDMSKLFDFGKIVLSLYVLSVFLSHPEEFQRMIQDIMMAVIHR